MPELLNTSKIADMIGVEAEIIKRTLERRDSDLAPYLHEPPPRPETEGEGKDISISSAEPTPLLNLEGLPQLITKLAFNIPTSDIIENLACQVLHLTILEAEKTELADKNRKLQEQNEQLQYRIDELQQDAKVSAAKISELVEDQSQKGFFSFFTRKK